MSFIMSNQKLLVVETNNLQFGSNTDPISVTLNLDQSVVTASPTVIVTGPTGAPFSITSYNTNTANPEIVFTLTGSLSDFVLGQNYPITLTANSQTDTFNVIFLLSETFNPTGWSNSNAEDNVGGYFAINQIGPGASLVSPIVNSIFRSILEFISLVNYKAIDLVNRFRIKHNLADIINCAIHAGAIPAGYTGKINYATDGTTNIASIILADTISDTDSYTLLTFTYETETVSIANNTPLTTGETQPAPTTSTYPALSQITVDRVTDNTGATVQYTLATINVTRSPVTFTSVVDPYYAITMNLVNGWTVA